MKPYECRRERFLLSTDKALLDIDAIHAYLSECSYWARERPRQVVESSIEHSLCFGLYEDERLVGFARVVTDYATFGWLCDLFILETHRGLGLGKWLVGCIIAHPDLQNIRRLLLATRDAHELYRRYGEFEALTTPDRLMVRQMGQGWRAAGGPG